MWPRSLNPLSSLKGRLALWVLLPATLIMAIDLWVVYNDSEKIATSVQQQLLHGSAKMISQQLVFIDGDYELNVPPAAFELFKSVYRDRIYYAVHTSDGKLISGGDEISPYAGSIQIEEDDFYLAQIDGEPVRVIVFAHLLTHSSTGEYAVTQVAQTLRGHAEFRDSLVRTTIRSHLLLLLITLTSMIFALRWTLKPLMAFGQTLSQREPGSLNRLELDAAPSELEPVVHALNDYAERLGQTLSAYEKFVSNTAHHLRTSFAIMTSQINFGKRNEAGDKLQHDLLDAIYKTLGDCGKLVNQFLVLASADQARQNQNRHEMVCLSELVTEVIENLAPLAQQRQIDLGVDEFDTSIRLLAPVHLLQEVFSNLIDNAIQHMGKPGMITITLRRQGDRALFRIVDDGVGIPQALQEKAFERFFRIDRSSAGNSGLGLAIVKEICTALGARISLQTPAGGNGLQVDIEFVAIS